MIYAWLAPPRIYVLLGGTVFLAFMLGWIFLSGSDSADETARKVKWELPDDSKEALFEDIEFLKNTGFFGGGGEIPDGEEDLNLNEGWRALGVVIEGDNDTKLLIKNEKGDVQSLKEGDTLPDERVVSKIEKDMFVVDKDGEQEEIRLYPMTKEEMRTDSDMIVDAEDVLDEMSSDDVQQPQINKPVQKSRRVNAPSRNSKEQDQDLYDLDEDLIIPDLPSLKSEKDRSIEPPPIPKDLLELLEEDDDLF